VLPEPRYVESVSHDPWFNLALEEWLFESAGPEEMVFYLWRNGPTVVIGRHQNPWVECRLEDMDRDGVKLARRPTGGGAVYHDLGNTNFTFTCRRDVYDVERQIGVILDGLRRVGVEARFSGRNDIVVGDRKVSGSAFRGRKDRWLHHGTLLLHADLGRLGHYLTAPPPRSRARASPPSARA
jgi:lipoate-protein ligase A